MSRLLPIVTLATALALAGVVYAHDGHMHHMAAMPSSATDQSFDAQMAGAMERMHRDMSVPPSGNYDRDFAAMMIPHHQGAVDMARVELQFGKDPVLRRLAQAIIVEQLQEIDFMKRQLQQLPVASSQPPRASD